MTRTCQSNVTVLSLPPDQLLGTRERLVEPPNLGFCLASLGGRGQNGTQKNVAKCRSFEVWVCIQDTTTQLSFAYATVTQVLKSLGSGVSLAAFNLNLRSPGTVGKLFNFSLPPSPALQKRDNNSIHFMWFF